VEKFLIIIQNLMKMRFPKLLKSIFIFYLSGTSLACEVVAQSIDTSQTVLSFEEYMSIVREHHPVAVRAGLQPLKGEAEVRKARGGFDPSVISKVSEKYFDDKQYYSLVNGGLTIPTWFGIELQSVYEQNEGVFLNPEHNVPDGGLWHVGVTIPVGQGLFIDERRTQLRQAQIYEKSTEAERQIILNDLLYEAGSAYWSWFEAYHNLRVYEEAYNVAEVRYNAVKQSASLGDVPPIDTLEASIQVQNRQLSLQQARLDYNNASALLSIYLWEEGMVPLVVSDSTVPVTREQVFDMSDNTILGVDPDSLLAGHPVLQQYRYKIDRLEVERRWKQEKLKPKLNLKYNAINEPIGGNPLNEYSIDNYTWGLELKIPILLREARGDLRMTDVKIRETRLDLKNKEAMLNYKADNALNTWATTLQQIDLYNQTVQDYDGLLSGERQMFEFGESSLFMVNARELGYINAQLKLIELLAKNRKASLSAAYALGNLHGTD